jgi:hypothetical protein
MLLMRIYSENSEEPKGLPAVAAVLPAEKLKETLVKWGLLPCCRLKKDELEAQGRRVLILRIPRILRLRTLESFRPAEPRA